jgi:hypothetical protein
MNFANMNVNFNDNLTNYPNIKIAIMWNLQSGLVNQGSKIFKNPPTSLECGLFKVEKGFLKLI